MMKEMKEYTITKTLFKMKKKTTYYRKLYHGRFGTVFLWGQIREMDLVTFASVLWTQNDGNFAVLVSCGLPLCLLCLFSLLQCFHFVLMITTCLTRTSCYWHRNL